MTLKKEEKNSYLPSEKRHYKKKYIERIVEEKEAEDEIEQFKESLNEDSKTNRRVD
jgi:uncharacterized membrane-anchored protein YjiN (DUF445 family)